ncbi:hypothetical protein LSTR_LSTR001989 [Laodelphax striatellus]|uniref:Uncharacterized protein n=1 Tax=Laodelphax striatellus TaxID=195883 RepID=A0A482XI67_LAOST|nr:hypothetical protein LSTR_LSTR001989 [Laodelphax striatellus]
MISPILQLLLIPTSSVTGWNVTAKVQCKNYARVPPKQCVQQHTTVLTLWTGFEGGEMRHQLAQVREKSSEKESVHSNSPCRGEETVNASTKTESGFTTSQPPLALPLPPTTAFCIDLPPPTPGGSN